MAEGVWVAVPEAQMVEISVTVVYCVTEVVVVVAAPSGVETAVEVGSTTAAGEVSATTVETGLTVEVDEVVELATSFTGLVETASKVVEVFVVEVEVEEDEEADDVATVPADPAAVVIPAGVVSVSVSP